MGDWQRSRAGTMFGPYHLKRLLGRGGMGEVYEAEHTTKEWTVAVKLMTAEFSKDPVFRERMKREARIAGRLQEPHVVPIHDYGEIDGQMYLEMRLIVGTDLDTMLKRFGPLTPTRAVAMITQIASALDAAHAVRVTHRDVKPPNILVTRDDFAYLVDFGIANAATDEKLTRMGEPVGTWKYMAPERFTKDKVTFRADVYSLACVLYECLTGSPPYDFDSAGMLISAHMMDPIPQPSAVRSGIPKAFDDVITCGMAKKPDDRQPSAGDLALAAHAALSTPDQDRAANIVRRSHESVLPPPKVEPRTVQHHRPPQPPPANPGPPEGRTPRPPRPAWGPPSGPIHAPDRLAPPHFPGNAWDGTPPGPPSPQPLVGAPGGWNQPPPPPPPPRNRNPWRMVAFGAAVLLVVILAGLGIWYAIHDHDDIPPSPNPSTPRTTPRTPTPTTTVTTTTATAPPAIPSLDQVNKLMSLLPSGYPTGTCTPQTQPMPGALVSVKCGQNTDANGPTVSAYGLYADVASLTSAFTRFTGTFAIQNCPGNMASPGKWWHNSDPNAILGDVACGVYKGNEPQVMWSNQQTLVFAIVGGNNLDPIYKWWTSHS